MEFGLVVKTKDLKILDKCSFEYTYHDPMELDINDPEKEIEINFETNEERELASLVINHGKELGLEED